MTRVNLPGQSSVRRSVAVIERLERRELFASTPTLFTAAPLVTDGVLTAPHTDPKLINAWGIAPNPSNGGFAVAANGTGVVSSYDAAGAPTSAAITVPAPVGSTSAAAPTGLVLNTAKSAFKITSGGTSAPATYLVATENGTIAGINTSVNATSALTGVDASTNGAVYKGLAVLGSGKSAQILAANFHNATVDVYDSKFQPVSTAAKFRDQSIPVGFAPFNVQVIANKVYVTYAMQDTAKHDDLAGAGNGYVDVFSTKGILMQRLAPQATALGGTRPFNSPWGLAKSPAGFGTLGNTILVANFGDGTIDAFNRAGALVAVMQGTSGQQIQIRGIWGLAAGAGKHHNALYLTAGLASETEGVLATLIAQARTKKG